MALSKWRKKLFPEGGAGKSVSIQRMLNVQKSRVKAPKKKMTGENQQPRGGEYVSTFAGRGEGERC